MRNVADSYCFQVSRTPSNYFTGHSLETEGARGGVHYLWPPTLYKAWPIPWVHSAELRYEPRSSGCKDWALSTSPWYLSKMVSLCLPLLSLLCLLSPPFHPLSLLFPPSPPTMWSELSETGHWPWNQADQNLTATCAECRWTKLFNFTKVWIPLPKPKETDT